MKTDNQTNNSAYLILEDGTVFEGSRFGADGEVIGELVFTTGMTGYLETLTDPSYYGQIILQTFPLIGNYGVIPPDFESDMIAAKAYIVNKPCENPSNFRSEGSLDAFLKERGIIGLYGIDTRALTKLIRVKGVMNGKITARKPADADMEEAKAYYVQNAVASVSKTEPPQQGWASEGSLRVALMDFGAKRGIAGALRERGCEVLTFPYNTDSETILETKPDGIMLSNGPGDPADPANTAIVETVRELQDSGTVVFGICLGHQLLALANGYKTEKLKFGHRGANQPVKDTATGRVYITSQNHGYTVVADDSAFVNVNDRTCEGLDFGKSFSVQFHPEAKAGPHDTAFLFDRFIEKMKKVR